MLSVRQLVRQEILPMAQNDEGDYRETFTNEELSRVVQLAQENGIALSDRVMAALENGYGYDKQTAIMELVKTEFGADYGAWTIEQQYWFGETMVMLGFRSDNPCCLPGENEPNRQDCEVIAQKEIEARYGDDVADDSIWEKRASFARLAEDGVTDAEPHWYLSWNARSTARNSYAVELTAQEEILSVTPSFAPTDDSTGNEIVDQYQQIYGSFGDWSVETWFALGQALRGREPGKARAWLFACANYILPPVGSVSQSEAEQLALDAAGETDTKVGSVVCCMDRGTPIWKITLKTLHPQDIGTGKYSRILLVELDALTGAVRNMQEYVVGSGMNMMLQWVPRSVVENPPPMPENG